MGETQQFREVVARLSLLTQAELTEVRGRIQHLTQGTVTGTVSSDKNLQIVLDVIYRTMQAAGADMTPPPQLQKTQQFKAMSDKATLVLSFLWDAGIRDQVMVRSVLMLAVDLLHRDLCAMGIACSSRTIMQHLHRIPATLNKHFPGYSLGGVLKKIVRNDKSLLTGR